MSNIELGDMVKWGWKRYSKKILSCCEFIGVVVDFPGMGSINVEKIRKTKDDMGKTIYETYEVMEYCDIATVLTANGEEEYSIQNLYVIRKGE